MRTDKKEYIVFGLGRFGRSVARQLEENGCRVLAVDRDQKKIDHIADDITRALCLDVKNEEAMEELGLNNFDGAIVSMGHNLEAAIFATIWAKEKGVGHIVAKAYDEMQGRILSRVGADEIVYPEREMGCRLANDLTYGRPADKLEYSSDYSVITIPIPNEWIGDTTDVRRIFEKYHVSIIAVKHNEYLNIDPASEKSLKDTDRLVLFGSNAALKKFQAVINK